MHIKNCLANLAVVVTILALSASATASTVVPMNIQAMADHTGQAFIATVQSVESYWADNPKRIETTVTFKEVDYIKGKPAQKDSSNDSTFSLTIPGGTIDDLDMHICCTPSFKPGDKYLLLLLPTYKTFPVVGLYQGAFIITTDADGTERVNYHRHGTIQPITNIDQKGYIHASTDHISHPHEHLASANGLSVTDRHQEYTQGITLSQLLVRLQPALNTSKSYNLDEPAGKRILVSHKPVPLRPAPNSDSTHPNNTERTLRGSDADQSASSAATRGRDQ